MLTGFNYVNDFKEINAMERFIAARIDQEFWDWMKSQIKDEDLDITKLVRKALREYRQRVDPTYNPSTSTPQHAEVGQ